MSDIPSELRNGTAWWKADRDISYAAAAEIERLRTQVAALREALDEHVRAAECIRHWHDTLGGEGMVVSAEHVRFLWEATKRARAALKEEKP